ncbi:MAG: TetR/AcrR family transcriptional regulator [Acidobacteriota bacterium]
MPFTMTQTGSRTDRQKRWREIMRSEILAAAVNLIRREGLEAMTVEGVADAAGVAKGTVYLYFETKQVLVESSIAAILDPLVAEVTGVLESEAPPEERLRGMVEANLRFFDEHRELFRVFVHGRYAPATQTARSRDAHYRVVLEHVTRVMREGIESGRFRSFDPEAVATIWLEGLTALILRRLQAAPPDPLEEDVDLLTGLLFEGVLLR